MKFFYTHRICKNVLHFLLKCSKTPKNSQIMSQKYVQHFFHQQTLFFLSSIFCCFIATCLFWPFNDFLMLLQILSLVLLWHQILLQGILIWQFHLQPFSLHGFSFELIVLDNSRAVSCNGPLSSWRSDRYVFPDNSEGISEGRLKFYH